MIEVGSLYSKMMIETLLNVHALTNMHRSSGNEEYRKMAAGCLPLLESDLKSLKHELTKEIDDEKE